MSDGNNNEAGPALSQSVEEVANKAPGAPKHDLASSDKWEGEAADDAYCPICQSCGEDGCCSLETSIMRHGCKYSEHFARQAYYDKMVIDEFHKLAEGLGLIRDETGPTPEDPIGDLYDRAWKRAEEKYGKA